MERKYWAKRNRHHKGPEYMRASKKQQFHTGYGELGLHFSIEWHNA
jgi:hypothetical protein